MAKESLHSRNYRFIVTACKIAGILFYMLDNPLHLAGQTTCNTATQFTPDTSVISFLKDSVQWFKFKADTSSYSIFVTSSGLAQNSVVSDIYLYSGNCASPVLIAHSNLSDSLFIHTDTLHDGKSYYIKIVRHLHNDGYFSLGICKDNGSGWLPDACPPDLCNIISNSDFEVINPQAFDTRNNLNILTPFYLNYICGWHAAKGSPQIQRHYGNTYASMWSLFYNVPLSNYGEAICTHAKMVPGTDYFVEFNYRIRSSAPDSIILGQSNNDTLTPPNNNTGTIFTSGSVICRTIFAIARPPADNIWKKVRLIYRTNVTSKLIYFFPYSTINTNQSWLDVDSVNIHPVPKVDAGDNQIICGISNVNIGNPATEGTPPYYYSWYPAAGLNNRHIETPEASPSATTIYRVTVSDSIGCKVVDSVKVAVFPPLLLNAGGNKTICPGGTVSIGGYAGGTSPLMNYSWNPAVGLADSTAPVTSANPAATTTYYETVIDGNGCIAKDRVIVYVTNILFNAGRDTSICSSSSVIIGNPASGGTAPYSYQWSPASGLSNAFIAQPTATPTVTTVYRCTVTDGNGCQAIDDITVHIVALPFMEGLTGSNNNCKTNKKTYTVINQNPNYTYTWHIIPQWAGVITGFQGMNKYGCTIQWSNIPDTSPPYAIVRVTAGYDNGTCYCESIKEMKVFNCCTNNNISCIALSDTIITTNLSRGRTYLINGTVVVNGNIKASKIGFCMGPESKIVVNPSKTFTIDTSAFTGFCNFMWDGIYLSDSTAKVIMRNDSLRDAYNALVSDRGGKYDITGSVFDRNLKDIIIRNYPAKKNPGMIRSSGFLCSGNLKVPYSSISRKRVSIDIYNAGRIVIGDSTGFAKRNTFINADTCIKSVYSNIRVYNNSFSNSTAINNTVAVHSFGNNAFSPNTTIVGNSNTSTVKRSNYFNNFDFGVRALYHQNIFVTNDTITSSGNGTATHLYGVTALNCYNGTKVYIKNNYINRQRIGVYAYEQFQNNLRITGNNITNHLAVGIQVNEAFATSIDTMIISGNKVRSSAQLNNTSIHGIITGNILPGADYPRIENNYVYIESYNNIYYPLSNGIRLFNCKNFRVTSNTVRQTGSLANIPDSVKAKQLNGIVAEYSRITDIGCNKVAKMGSAFLFRYDCDTSRLLRNTIDTFFYGVRFDTARIANQGNSTTVYDNKWQPHYYNNTLYKKTKGTFIWLTNIYWYFRNSSTIYDPTPKNITLGTLITTGLSNPSSCPQCNTFLPKSTTSIIQITHDFNSSISPEGGLMPQSGPGTQGYLSDDYFKLTDIYRSLRDNPRITVSNSALLNVYNNLGNGNVGNYVRFTDLIAQRDYEEASTLNDAFIPVNLAETNIRTVNGIYLDTWAKGRYEFTPDEYAALSGIASQSPYTSGPAVYSARVMLGCHPDDMQQRNLEDSGPGYIDTNETPVFGIPYPNPVNDKISLDYHLPPDYMAEFIIYNLNGQLVGKYALNSGERNISISLGHLNDGLYIYRIVGHNDEISHRGKFIISRYR